MDDLLFEHVDRADGRIENRFDDGDRGPHARLLRSADRHRPRTAADRALFGSGEICRCRSTNASQSRIAIKTRRLGSPGRRDDGNFTHGKVPEATHARTSDSLAASISAARLTSTARSGAIAVGESGPPALALLHRLPGDGFCN